MMSHWRKLELSRIRTTPQVPKFHAPKSCAEGCHEGTEMNRLYMWNAKLKTMVSPSHGLGVVALCAYMPSAHFPASHAP